MTVSLSKDASYAIAFQRDEPDFSDATGIYGIPDRVTAEALFYSQCGHRRLILIDGDKQTVITQV